MTALLTNQLSGRSLITPELFDRLVGRITCEHHLPTERAEAVMSDALAFLAACADNTGAPLSPSPHVDVGWHTFLLHTHEYAEFCHRIAGRFLHHVPTDGAEHSGGAQRTVAAITAAGFAVEPSLWHTQATECTGCHGGCHDDPPPPPATR